MPITAVTDSLDGRLTVVSMLAALALALWATSRLLWRARRWRLPDDPPLRRWEPAAFGLFVAAVGLASPLLFLAARPLVYHEVEIWGTATTLLAIERLFHWWDAPSTGRLAAASLAATIAFNTRASVGGGAVAALALVLVLSLLWHMVPWRAVPALVLAVLVPVATYAAVNVARFDSLFSVPFEEQEFTEFNEDRRDALEATGGTLFGPDYAPSALATYLRPDGIALQRLFPWVTFRETDTIIGDPVFDTTDRSASLPMVAPGFLVLAFVGVRALLRRRGRDPWLAATVGAAIGLISTVTIAFIAHRYLADFVPVLVIPGTLGLWTLGQVLDRTDGREAARRGGRSGRRDGRLDRHLGAARGPGAAIAPLPGAGGAPRLRRPAARHRRLPVRRAAAERVPIRLAAERRRPRGPWPAPRHRLVPSPVLERRRSVAPPRAGR